MERSGWIPGLVLMFLMSLANAFSVEVVFRLCRLTGRPTSLGEIGDKAPPLRTPAIRSQTFGGPRFLWVIVTVAIATPIAFLKDMDSLRHTSFAAVAILLYIVARSRPHPPSRERQQLGRRENSGERRERRRSSSSMRRSTRATATRPSPSSARPATRPS